MGLGMGMGHKPSGIPCLSDGELLHALAGVLPVADAVRIEDHIDACLSCRTLLVELVRAAPAVFCGDPKNAEPPSDHAARSSTEKPNWHKRV
jgi:hypothetical protein